MEKRRGSDDILGAAKRQCVDMQANPEDTSLEVVAFCNGDVIFLLESGRTKVKVSSGVMSAASPVFAAILGPNFKEGQAMASSHGQPVEIPLPDDNPKGFIPICRILHYDRKLRHPTVEELLHIVTVAHKYDLIPVLKSQVNDWFERHMSTLSTLHTAPDMDSGKAFDASHVIKAQRQLDKKNGYTFLASDVFLLLLVSYKLKAEEPFKTISRRLILEHAGSFNTLAVKMKPKISKSIESSMLYELAGVLQDTRAYGILTALSHLQSTMLTRMKENQFSDDFISQYFVDLDLYNAETMFGGSPILKGYSLFEVISCILCFEPEIENHESTEANELLSEIFDGLRDKTPSLCPCWVGGEQAVRVHMYDGECLAREQAEDDDEAEEAEE